jgi:uncharacterized membrane protein YdjX (TVP38/TMEM64 family)
MTVMQQDVAETGRSNTEETPDIEDEGIEQAQLESGFSHDLNRLLILLVIASAIFALLYFTPIGAIVRDVQTLRAYLQGDDLWAELTFAAMTAGLVAIGVPRLIFYGIGGLAFGFWQGLLLAQFGTLLGSFMTFYAVRHGGRDWLLNRFGQHRFVGKAFRVRSSIKAVVLIRQLPLHSLMITGGLALSEVSARIFLLGSFIGFLPQGLIATLISSGIVAEKATESVGKLVIAAVVLLSGVGLLHLRKRHLANRASATPQQ